MLVWRSHFFNVFTETLLSSDTRSSAISYGVPAVAARQLRLFIHLYALCQRRTRSEQPIARGFQRSGLGPRGSLILPVIRSAM